MSVSRDGLLLSERASEVNFRPVLAQTGCCLGSRKKASINHKTRGQTSQRGQRSEVEKSKRLDGTDTLGAATSESSGFAAAVALFHVKPRRESRQVVYQDKVTWSSPGALNDYDHCRVLSFLASHNPRGEMPPV